VEVLLWSLFREDPFRIPRYLLFMPYALLFLWVYPSTETIPSLRPRSIPRFTYFPPAGVGSFPGPLPFPIRASW